MKVYILVDLEGVGGVAEYDDWQPHLPGHQLIRQRMIDLMVGEVNAAVEGALAADARTVIVRDSHSGSNNISLKDLHPKALLSHGSLIRHPLPHLSSDFTAVIMIGQHTMAGNQLGCLSHTYSRRIRSVYVNGVAMGEIGLNAAIAGELGVPVCFVSGDSETVKEARYHLGAVTTVETKMSHSLRCVLSRAPDIVHQEITAGVKCALEKVEQIEPFQVSQPVELRISYHNWYINVARYWLRRQWRWGKLENVHTIRYQGDSLTLVWQRFITAD